MSEQDVGSEDDDAAVDASGDDEVVEVGRVGGSTTDDIKEMARSMSLSDLFRERLAAENPDMLSRYDRRIDELRATGLSLPECRAKAGPEFGRKSGKQERKLFVYRMQYASRAEDVAKKRDDAAQKHQRSVERKLHDFLKTLPVTSSIDREMSWIGAHPAMNRKLLSKTPGLVRLTLDDFKHPPHGPAPSQRAVVQLRHWVNNPQTFFNKLVHEQAKSKPSKDDGDDDGKGGDTEAIDRLLGL